MTDKKMPYPPEEHIGGVFANHRHVSSDEAHEARDTNVGKGTPTTAPLELSDDWSPIERVVALVLSPFRR